MSDIQSAMRALRQIRGGGDSPVRRLAEMAAARTGKLDAQRGERLDYEDDVMGSPDPQVLSGMMLNERMAASPHPDDAFIRDAYSDRPPAPGVDDDKSLEAALAELQGAFAGLDNGYQGREALGPSPSIDPGYSAAGQAPQVGMVEDDEDEEVRTLAALMGR
jgi:hypothetical protein